MVATRKNPDNGSRTRRPPARTPEAREAQLVGMAVDLAERQLADGTASTQVITHFLKLAGEREKLEKEKLRQENELLKARITAIGSAAEVQKLYTDALNAMRAYSGQEVEPDYED